MDELFERSKTEIVHRIQEGVKAFEKNRPHNWPQIGPEQVWASHSPKNIANAKPSRQNVVTTTGK